MTFQINGPNGGNGIIFGNTFPNDDIINAFDFNNLIISGGANDQINTGAGFATVDLGAFIGVTDTVNVGGANNKVTSGAQSSSTLTVQGGTGNNLVTLANSLGNNNVAMQGYNNVITVNGDANNILLSGAGRGKIFAGKIDDGNFGFSTSVAAAGQNNMVIGGDQDFFVSGGQGMDLISLGNGNNTIFEAGQKDKITVGTGSNTITDFGGFATIHFVEHIVTAPFPNPQTVNIGGTNNTVSEDDLTSDRDFTITGGTGNGKFTLGNGVDVLTTSGSNNVVVMGTTDKFPFGDAVTILGGVNNSVTIGDGNNVVKVDGVASTITLGNGGNTVLANGNDDVIHVGNGGNTIQANGTEDAITAGNGSNSITANGDDDVITAGNGGNTITANGKEDIITLGNGNNTLTANGNVDVINIGNGNNKVTALGNGDIINLGTGNNSVNANPVNNTSNNDTITSLGGKGTFTLGGQSSLTLTASLAGTTVDAQSASDTITLNNNANVDINDSPFGGGLNLIIFATGGANAGVIKLTGFESDVTGLIDLQGFTGITNTAQLLAASGSDGSGGTLIHLGAGSLDLVGSTINNASFVFT